MEETLDRGICVQRYLHIKDLVKNTYSNDALGDRIRHYFETIDNA